MMNKINPLKKFYADKLKVQIYSDRVQMGRAAGEAVALKIKDLMKNKENIRIIFAAAPSQNDILAALSQIPNLDWSKVTAFHMDEYLGLSENAPQLFGNYLKQHIFDIVPLRKIFYLNPEPIDIQAECNRYSDLIKEAPIDIVCMGIGENGHIAFNDPPVADFNDPEIVKVVELDKDCRQQQVNDGCFETLAHVPKKAMTLTVPTLMSAESIFVVVPGPTKANAVFKTLKGTITTNCPASIIRLQEQAKLYLDIDAAAQIM